MMNESRAPGGEGRGGGEREAAFQKTSGNSRKRLDFPSAISGHRNDHVRPGDLLIPANGATRDKNQFPPIRSLKKKYIYVTKNWKERKSPPQTMAISCRCCNYKGKKIRFSQAFKRNNSDNFHALAGAPPSVTKASAVFCCGRRGIPEKVMKIKL